MSSRGSRPHLDEGLRITVGNDVYFQRSEHSPRRNSRSPSGDLRNRLGPRPGSGQRVSDDKREMYMDGRPQSYPHHRSLGTEQSRWPPSVQAHYGPHTSHLSIESESRRGAKLSSPNRLVRNQSPQFQETASYFANSDVNQYDRSPRMHRGASPRRRHSPSPLRYSPVTHRKHSRSPHRRHHPSPPSRYRRTSPHRHSRSPRRRSPDHYSRRSLSRNSRSRRRSSSDSSDSQNGTRRSSSNPRLELRMANSRLGSADDLLLTMYSGNAADEDRGRGYAHPVLDRNSALSQEQRRGNVFTDQDALGRAYANAGVVADEHALSALTEAYTNASPPPKRYGMSETMDDEERFLYGDGPPTHYDSGRPENRTERALPEDHPSLPPKKNEKEEKSDSTQVTPGGFDTNALKNVLKAIGFDFELSAQSLEKAAKVPTQPNIKDKPTRSPPKDIKPVDAQSNQSHRLQQSQDSQQTATVPLQQNLSGHQSANPVAVPVYGTRYQISAPQQVQTGQYIAQQMLPSQTGTGGVYIYQPQASGPPRLVYQPHPLSSTVAQQPSSNDQHVQARSNLKVVQTSKRDNSKPVAKYTPEVGSFKSDKLARQKRLNYLELELNKLKKHQSELVKKKQRQMGGEMELKKNSLLQAGVEKQIKAIRQAAEHAAGIADSSESSESDQSDDSNDVEEEPKYFYTDIGNYTCRICDDISSTVKEYLTHLHSKVHKKAMDPTDKPWVKKGNMKNTKKPAGAVCVQLRGSEFIMPVMSFYCKICKQHFVDEYKAEDHCRGAEHNMKFKKFCRDHPQYEKKSSNVKSQKAKEEEESRKDRLGDGGINDRKTVQQHHESSKPRFGTWKVNEGRFVENRGKERSIENAKDASVEKGRREHFEKPKRERTPPRQMHDVPPQRAGRRRSPRRRSRERSREPSPPKSYGSPYERSLSDRGNRNYEGRPLKQKRRFEEATSERKRVKEEKKATRHGGRWSPGYDAYEGNQSEHADRVKARPGAGDGAKSPSGLGFGRFSWKKKDEKPVESQSSDLARSKESEKRVEHTVKSGKPQTLSPRLVASSADKIAKSKSSLTGKIGNWSPHTRVLSSGRTKPVSTATSQPNPPTNAVLATASRPIPTLKSVRPLGIAKPGPPTIKIPRTRRPANITVETKTTAPLPAVKAKEPPPPGTEDILEAPGDGNISDASGISMELASDEDV